MVDYNNFAKTFSRSRENMKWEEITYFLSLIGIFSDTKILDIGCGNGRLLGELIKNIPVGNYGIVPDLLVGDENIHPLQKNYTGVDLSEGLLEEARKIYPEYDFLESNMLDIQTNKSYDIIFMIASFHHLTTLKEREKMLDILYKILPVGGKIYMTNWSLKSNMNILKYAKSEIISSINQYGGSDFEIKIGEFSRYYHCFSLGELEYVSEKSGFKIIENREFENQKNFITILEK